MNEMISTIPAYLSKQISDMVSSDPSIVNLSIGEPYFKPPSILYDNFKKLLFPGDHDYASIPNKYADSKGALKLRQEIAARYKTLYCAELDPEVNILITHGASEAIWLSILTLTSLGDEVIIPDPSYMMYETAVKLLGRTAIKIPTLPENGFCLTINQIERAITAKTKLILINSPENPTGAVYDNAIIKKIHNIAKAHNFHFVHDEVYDAFVFAGKHQNIFRHQDQPDATCVLINSFSKKFSMMGWRLGWLVGNSEFISNATKVHTNLTLNLGIFHQNAAASILNDSSIENYFESHVKTIKNNIHLLKNSLFETNGFHLDAETPKGAFFLFPCIKHLFDAIPEKFKRFATKGECVAQYLLSEHKIAVVPGIVYGKSGSDFIRIVASVEEKTVQEAAKRFSEVGRPVVEL